MSVINTNPNPGLFDRVASAFAPKGKKAVVDKMLFINTLLWMILILGAVRVIDASLKVNAEMGNPILLWGVAIFTLSLTEGGFVAWKNFRYSPTSNKAQKDVALGGMILSFTASVIVGMSDYIGLSMGDTEFVLGGNTWTGNEVMTWAFGIAYVIAIVGHVVCALLVRELDDDVQADNEENQIVLAGKVSERSTRAAEQRTQAHLAAAERAISMHARTIARLTVAPALATTEAIEGARRKLAEDYGVSAIDMEGALDTIRPIAQELTARVCAESVRIYLKENDGDGPNPDKVASAIRDAGELMAKQTRALSGPRRIAPPPLNIPAMPPTSEADDEPEHELSGVMSPNGHSPNGHKKKDDSDFL